MNIKIASLNDYNDIRELWELVFSEDSQAYLDFYFDIVMSKNRVIIIRENELLVAMLHLNPYEVQASISEINYIVGVATHPNYRRKGMMRKMLEYANDLAIKENIDLMLVPEDERFYKPFGYEFVSKQYNTTIHTELYQSMIMSDVISSYYMTQDQFINWFSDNNYNEKYFEVRHTKDYLVQLYKEVSCEDGLLLNINGNVVLYYLEEMLEIRKVYLKNTQEDEVDLVLSKLLEIAGHKNIIFHEVNEPLLSGKFPYAKINNYDYRPYMMKLNIKGNKDKDIGNKEKIYFDEVI